MAQNPINPGYSPQKPGETPANPLSMGYYPGKKLPRKFIPSAGSHINTGGFNVDGTAITSEYLDSVADTAYNTIRGPDTWVRKRMDDDLKQALKINALPPEGVPVERLDDFDTGTLPGGGFISLSVDPRDWAGKDERTHKDKAPEMVKKTLKDWAGGVIKFADYETKARGIFWKEVVNGSFDLDPKTTTHTSFEIAAYKKMTRTYAPEINIERDGNPFQLSGRGIYDKGQQAGTLGEMLYTQGKDVYQDSANKLDIFQKNINAGSKRGQTYYEYQNSTLYAVSTELSQKAKSEVAESFVKRQNLLNSWVVQGVNEKKTLESITHAFDNELNEWSFKGIKDKLKDYKETVEKSSKALENAGSALEKAYGAASLKEWTEAVKAHKEIIGSDSFNSLINATSHEGMGGNLTETLRSIGTAGGMKESLIGGGHHGGSTIHNSLERKYSDRLAMELMGKTGVHQLIIDNGLEANRAIALLNGQSVLNGLGGAKEVAGVLFNKKKGLAGVGEAYLWNAGIQGTMDLYISPIAPKTFVKKALYATNNFGLVLPKDDVLEAKGWDMDYRNAPKGLFANKFKIDIASSSGIKRVEVWGGEHFNAIGTLSEWKKTGFLTDNHVKAFLVDGKTVIAKGINEQTVKQLTIQQLKNGRWEFSMLDPVSGNKKLVNVISKEFEDMNLLAGCETAENVRERVANLLEAEDKFKNFKNIEEFREWAAINVFQKYGLDINDEKIWKDLVTQLNANTSNWINKRYIGVMQRIGNSITRIQNQIYKIPLIGYAAKQFNGALIYISMLKTQVVDFVRTKIIGTLTKMGLKGLVATALQSFMTFTLPIIGNVFAFIVTEILDRIVRLLFKPVKQFLGLLKKMAAGELTAALEVFEKEQDKRVKFILFILTIILTLYAFFSPIIELFIPNIWNLGGMVTVDPFSDLVPFSLSTFAPVDETRKFGSLPQSYDWDIVLDPTGQSLANGPSYGLGGDGSGECNCVANTKNIPPSPSVSGRRAQIINTAKRIANDLQPGFWCYYNHSPNLYPQYWNQSLFDSDPCYRSYTPGNGDPMALFWCTYMVDASHGLSFNNAGVTDVEATLRQKGYAMVGGNAPISSLKPGDVIFLGGYIHVGMVYSVTSDGIFTIESNASNVSNFIPTTDCGSSSCPLSGDYLSIDGYALLR